VAMHFSLPRHQYSSWPFCFSSSIGKARGVAGISSASRLDRSSFSIMVWNNHVSSSHLRTSTPVWELPIAR
jgi:hypothetical protein